MKDLNCFFIGANHNFLGGISLFQRNLIEYLKLVYPKAKITLAYPSKESEVFFKERVEYRGLKTIFEGLIGDLVFNMKVVSFLKRNNFEIINSHAIWGYWMNFYRKPKGQKIVHTYHGVSYYFFKNHLKRFSFFKKILFSPLLFFSYFIEKPPVKKADKIICVSEKVRRQVEKLYGKKGNIVVIRTGVDLKDFKFRDKKNMKKKLGLKMENFYGLYVGRGGYWTKGLDRVVEISREIYKQDKRYRLIVIGADYKKTKHLLDEKFIIYREKVERKDMPYYYNASDLFFCMSRYEGGAPTLVVSEAMASGCLVVCAKSAEQEIIRDKKNGLIIEEFGEKEVRKILENLGNKKIISNAKKTVGELSLKKWGEKYLNTLLK